MSKQKKLTKVVATVRQERKAEDLVDGEGWISDESSFYGDEDGSAEWEATAASDPPLSDRKENNPWHLSTLAFEASLLPPEPPKKKTYNPFADQISGRQLSESVSDFLTRLPPSTTLTSNINDAWIWVANPSSSVRETDSRVDQFIERGFAILAKLETERIRNEGKKAVINRFAKDAHEEILKAAREEGVKGGKWMLFPKEENLDQTWKLICEGVVSGELGQAAKVAAKTEGEDDSKVRVIIVYTKDFDDKDDLKRVVVALKGMGLVRSDKLGGQSMIYYKCDAYTYLGIESSNRYGLRASMHSSKEWL